MMRDKMTSKKLFTGIALAAFALALAATTAVAEDENTGIKNSGLFLGGGAGLALFDRYTAENGSEDLSLNRESEESAAYKISAIWNMCEYAGIEFGYMKIDEGADDQEPDGITAAILPTLPLPWMNLSLLGRVGVFLGTQDFEDGTSETQEELTYGVGVGWQATDLLSFRTEWERIDFDEEVDVVWVSAYFRVSNP
jgi:opacity protein-like surface antigen